MDIFKTYSVTEAARTGFSTIIRNAVEEGLVILKKHDEPVAMVLPLGILGMQRFLRKIDELMMSDPDMPSELRDILVLYKKFLSGIE